MCRKLDVILTLLFFFPLCCMKIEKLKKRNTISEIFLTQNWPLDIIMIGQRINLLPYLIEVGAYS